MAWRRLEHWPDPADVAEELVRDDDRAVLGTILQFSGEGPTYAWVILNDGEWGATRLGGHESVAAAREAVEEARLPGKAPGSALWRP